MQDVHKMLDATKPQKVKYCIPEWLRNEQVKASIKRIQHRIQPGPLCKDQIALVGFGPSLNDTYEQIKNFKYIMTCSGSHKFLIDKGFKPSDFTKWRHIDVDPRPHKAKLIGQPQHGIEYLIASACSQAVFDLLEGYDVKLWHIFQTDEESARILPRGEYAITGGCSVGLRMLTIARFLGFTNLHIFGLDGNESDKYGKHASEHPMQPKGYSLTEYPPNSGKMWKTTESMLEVARSTFHELDMLGDVKATFYGEGLTQEMAKFYKSSPNNSVAIIGISKPELISKEYREQNKILHETNLQYGTSAYKHVDTVKKLIKSLEKSLNKTNVSVLDYGAGKGLLGKYLDFPIYEYDPAIPGKDEIPKSADLVVCIDVLEHIEPDKLDAVLADLQRCTRQVGYFIIDTKPAIKTLPDGRNTHLILEDEKWWYKQLDRYFNIAALKYLNSREIYAIVGPRKNEYQTHNPYKEIK